MDLASMILITIVGFPNWTNSITKKPVTEVRCSPAMKAPLLKALACLKSHDASESLKTYQGCYNKRKIAGTDRWSNHAYGHALDINAGLSIDPIIVECFEGAGFKWGGRWPGKRRDPMHWELPRKKGK